MISEYHCYHSKQDVTGTSLIAIKDAGIIMLNRNKSKIGQFKPFKEHSTNYKFGYENDHNVLSFVLH